MTRPIALPARRLRAIALVVSVLAALTLAQPLPADAAGGATIAGHTNARNMTLYNAVTSQPVKHTAALGDTYEFINVPPGKYTVGFVGGGWPSLPQMPEFWSNKATLAKADVISVTAAETISDIDGFLAIQKPSATGTFTADGYPDPMGAELSVYRADGSQVIQPDVRHGPRGQYSVYGLPPGTYHLSVRFRPYAFNTRMWATTFLGNVPLMSQSQPMVVTDGVTTINPPVNLPAAGHITGRVFSIAGGSQSLLSTAAIEVSYFNDQTGSFERMEEAWVDHLSPGAYAVLDLWPGRYLVRFLDSAESGLAPVWWPDVRYRDLAEEIVVGAGRSVEKVDAYLDVQTVNIHRIGGVDRYATNVEMSRTLFPADDGPYNIPVLYVASGENYPDALSAGPAAIQSGGELLLVRRSAIPAVVLAEIKRVNPKRIVVVGGPAAVEQKVLDQLASIAPTTRIGGADRYEVSRAVVEEAFGCGTPPCVDSIFIATGNKFPDALSAGPAAGHEVAPVLLVRGGGTSLDADTVGLLEDLGVSKAFIAGGAASVSQGVEASLNAVLASSTKRFAGADRYATAALINEWTFDDSEVVFLASGSGFADALAGGALAGAFDAPLYLVRGNCIPTAVIDEIVDLHAVDVILLGGEGVLAPTVASLTEC